MNMKICFLIFIIHSVCYANSFDDDAKPNENNSILNTLKLLTLEDTELDNNIIQSPIKTNYANELLSPAEYDFDLVDDSFYQSHFPKNTPKTAGLNYLTNKLVDHNEIHSNTPTLLPVKTPFYKTKMHKTIDCKFLNNTKTIKLKNFKNIGTQTESPTIRILALDGGGVRGIIESYILKKIEFETGSSIKDMFHLIAGTSIGGILACALSLPLGKGNPKTDMPKFSASQIYDLFYANSKNMFKKNYFSCYGWFGTKYHTRPLESFIDSIVENHIFQHTTTNIIVPTYDMTMQNTKIFKSWDNSELFLMKDVMLATSAAPTYFKPRKIFPLNTKKHMGYNLLDGGVVANNPSGCAISCIKEFNQFVDIDLISIGTGYNVAPMRYSTMKNAGLIKWAKELPGLTIDSQAYSIEAAIEPICKNYYRYTPFLDSKNINMDDVSANNIKALIASAERMIFATQNEFYQMIQLLKKPKDDLVNFF